MSVVVGIGRRMIAFKRAEVERNEAEQNVSSNEEQSGSLAAITASLKQNIWTNVRSFVVSLLLMLSPSRDSFVVDSQRQCG